MPAMDVCSGAPFIAPSRTCSEIPVAGHVGSRGVINWNNCYLSRHPFTAGGAVLSRSLNWSLRSTVILDTHKRRKRTSMSLMYRLALCRSSSASYQPECLRIRRAASSSRTSNARRRIYAKLVKDTHTQLMLGGDDIHGRLIPEYHLFFLGGNLSLKVPTIINAYQAIGTPECVVRTWKRSILFLEANAVKRKSSGSLYTVYMIDHVPAAVEG